MGPRLVREGYVNCPSAVKEGKQRGIAKHGNRLDSKGTGGQVPKPFWVIFKGHSKTSRETHARFAPRGHVQMPLVVIKENKQSLHRMILS